MAIDIRAKVTCKIGSTEYDVISASVSDSYIQESGIIYTSGDVEINGLVSPKSGNRVYIYYEKKNIKRQIPRYLRVLSSFADPFTRTTKISLGCTFTYLSNSTEAPVSETNETTSVITANSLNCLNDYAYPPGSDYPPPISASSIAQKCFQGLGLAGPSGILTNNFVIEKFVIDSPYVDILSDLFLSESKCIAQNVGGSVDNIDLDMTTSSSGAVITDQDIISIGQINSGDLDADKVIVNYTTLVLEPKDPEELSSQTEQVFNSDYTYEESYGEAKSVSIQTNNGSVTAGSYVPYSNTTQEYGEDLSWDPDTCIIYSSGGEKPDLSDKVIKKIEKIRLCVGEEAANYVGEAYSIDPGIAANIACLTSLREVVTNYTYDDKGNIIREYEVTSDPTFCLWGKINMSFVDGSQLLPLPTNTLSIVSIKETTYEYTYPPLPSNPYPSGVNAIEFLQNYSIEPSTDANTVVTVVSELKHPLYYTTQQHSVSKIANEATMDLSQKQAFILGLVQQYLQPTGRTVNVSTGRVSAAVVYRPKQKDRLIRETGTKVEESSEVEYISGTPIGSGRLETYTMPYQDSDIFSPTGDIIKGNAQAAAKRYGKVQNDIKRGHRNGMSIQTVPEKLPTKPYESIIIDIGGASAHYKLDGMTWTADSNGIIVSCDALLAGGVGGALADAFFPVAPGVTTLPSKPPTIDNTPSAVLGSVVTVGSDPQTVLNAAFPGATSNQAVQNEANDEFWVSNGAGSWTNIGTTFGQSSQNFYTVPIVNILTKVNLAVRTKLIVSYFNYDIYIAPVQPSIPAIRTMVIVSSPVLIGAASIDVTGNATNQTGSLAILVNQATVSVLPTGLTFAGDIYNEFAHLAIVSISMPVYGLPAIAGGLVFGFETTLYSNQITCEAPYTLTPPAITEGTPIITDEEKRWHNYSLLIDGTTTQSNNRVTFFNPLNFANGDYCVEFWIYIPSSHPDNYFRTPLTFGAKFSIDIDINTTNYAPNDFGFYHYLASTSGNEIYHGPGSPTATGSFDTWTHVAAYRLNGLHYIAVNGIVDENYTEEALADVFDFSLSANGQECAINDWLSGPGFASSFSNLLLVYFDDIRFTAGNAVYSGVDFVPPSSPFSSGGNGNFSIEMPASTINILGLPSGGSTAGNIFNYTDFASTTGLELISTYQVSANNIYLTNLVSDDVGNVWLSEAVGYQNSFRVEWNMECTGGAGADGFTLQWHTANNVNGGSGGAAGRVTNSVHAFKFATFFVQKFQWLKAGSFTPALEEMNALSGNGWRQNVYYWFDYDYDLSQGKVYYSTTASKPATASHTLNSLVFGNTPYYIGIGAGTGGYDDYHILKSWKVYTV